jgi:hypothetical protein
VDSFGDNSQMFVLTEERTQPRPYDVVGASDENSSHRGTAFSRHRSREAASNSFYRSHSKRLRTPILDRDLT